jgi:hypothetical protein
MTSRSLLTRELNQNPGLNHEIAGPRIWEPTCRKPVDLVNTFTDANSVEGVNPPLQIQIAGSNGLVIATVPANT